MANPLEQENGTGSNKNEKKKKHNFSNPLFSLVFVQWQWAKWSRQLRNRNDFFSNLKWCQMRQDIRYGTQHINDIQKKTHTILLAQSQNGFKWQTTKWTAMQTTLSLDVKIQFVQSGCEIQIEWHLRLPLTELRGWQTKAFVNNWKYSGVFPIAVAAAATILTGKTFADGCWVLFITYIEVAIDGDDAMQWCNYIGEKNKIYP